MLLEKFGRVYRPSRYHRDLPCNRREPKLEHRKMQKHPLRRKLFREAYCWSSSLFSSSQQSSLTGFFTVKLAIAGLVCGGDLRLRRPRLAQWNNCGRRSNCTDEG